jgi:hypothetical protein
MLPFLLAIVIGQSPPVVTLTLVESRPLGYAKTHHVQGLAMDAKRVYVSSVERATQLGWLFVFDRTSLAIESTHRIALASQYHPGGMQLRDGRLYLPLAEYRPRSSASLLTIDLAPLDDPNKSHRRVAIRAWTSIDDHIGGIGVDLEGRMFVANWDAKLIRIIGTTGQAEREFPNPTGVAYQEMEWHDGFLWCAGNTNEKEKARSVVDLINPASGQWEKRYLLAGKRPDGSNDFAHEGFTKEGNQLWLLPEDGPKSTLYRFELPVNE